MPVADREPGGGWVRRVVLLLVGTLLLGGCAATTIQPPPTPESPTTILLLDHGLHASLVLPDEHGMAVRYSYGDWDYYALGQTRWRDAWRALFRQTPAALGRQVLDGPIDEATIRAQLRVGVEQAWPITVERADALNLQDSLHAQFMETFEGRHYRADIDTWFVPHPLPYRLGNNSNWMVAQWLRALGGEVAGQPLLSRWRVQSPSSTPDQSMSQQRM